MSEKPITITIKGKVGYEDEITVAQAARIITLLNTEGHACALGADLDAGLGTSRRAPTRQKPGAAIGSAREALDLSGAKTNPEKIVALAHTSFRTAATPLKSDAIKSQFQRARETTPANFAATSTAIY